MSPRLTVYKLISLSFAILRSLIPGIIREKQGKPFFGANAAEAICIIFLMINTLYVYSICFINMFGGIYDLQMKNYLQSQMAHLISMRRNHQIDPVKILPTINIFNSFSLTGWSILQRVCFDYGQSF